MALPTNKMSQDALFTGQGARPTEKSENERVETVNATTGEAQVTENTENKRVSTVVR
ncbi:Hypothetical Protein OBI_RACECAR_122 [Arthrobacter phage Racecar]|jgi:hypothetical protein|nr:hypothetical protein PBI_RACECAR_204 [Arthrobacter phage Racecar]QFG12871.1 hypothetical protein PBI_MIMI_201 [Arthrobacter phage Mimi]